MKARQELETLRKQSIQDLRKERRSLELSYANSVSNLTESGKKNSKETKLMKKKIARIETLVLEKIDEQLKEGEAKNG